MLSQETFEQQFELLAARFGIKNLEVAVAYYDLLSQIPDYRFIQVCRVVFRDCDRLPPPKFFLDEAAQLARQERMQTLSLPSEVDLMTSEQILQNKKRLAEMTRNLFKTKSEIGQL